MRIITTDELNTILDNGPVLLFGTGFVARLFCTALGERAGRILSCIVSKRAELKEQEFHRMFPQIPICTANEIDLKQKESAAVLIAAHESLTEEIDFYLQNAGFKDRIWIYPNLHDLSFGKAEGSEQILSVRDILQNQPDNEYWIELRYSAFCEYFEQKEPAYSLYRKGMELFSNPETVTARIGQIAQLAESMKQHGFLKEFPILLDEEKRMIDGLHRLSAAAYLGITEIPCRMVKKSDQYEALLPETLRLKEDLLQEKEFSPEEIRRLKAYKDQMPWKPQVSLVIPVYNVADYMDVCIESVLRQSFHDFEVILINDGSTDGSEEKCRQCAKKDVRVRYIDQDNHGVSFCRNLGVALSRGDVCGFIDPDDWIEPDYLEILYHSLLEEDADFAECDIFRYQEKTKKEVIRRVYGKMGIAYTLEEHMKYAPTASYKSLFRKKLWTVNDVKMPACAFESPAVYALVLALAEKIINIRLPLYHYRVGRPDSLIENGYSAKDGKANNTLGVEAMQYLISEFHRAGLYDPYRTTLEELVKYRLSDILATQFTRKNPSDYKETVHNYRKFLNEMFPGSRAYTYLNISGYNLNRILTYLNQLHDPFCRFNFSSLIAIAGYEEESEKTDGNGIISFTHHNKYRSQMIAREIQGAFWDVLKEVKPDYVFLDLIEERFDILRWNGHFLTASDALEEADISFPDAPEKIRRNSMECKKIWERSLKGLKAGIRKYSSDTRIVIVENYLSEKVGNIYGQKAFPELSRIRETNRILKEYYTFAKEELPDAVMIPAFECEYYYTDEEYEYGAIPSHLNEVVNKRIAVMITERLN